MTFTQKKKKTERKNVDAREKQLSKCGAKKNNVLEREREREPTHSVLGSLNRK